MPPLCCAVFLAGIPQDCMMSFMTSNDTSIPEQATVRVLASADVSIHWHNHTSRTVVNTDAGTIEHWLTLPTVPPDTSHDCHMTITLPDMKHVAMETTESHDQPEQLPVWEHMVRGEGQCSESMVRGRGSVRDIT